MVFPIQLRRSQQGLCADHRQLCILSFAKTRAALFSNHSSDGLESGRVTIAMAGGRSGLEPARRRHLYGACRYRARPDEVTSGGASFVAMVQASDL